MNVVEHFNNEGDKTCTVYVGGNEYWYKNEDFHREDGPAIIYRDGDKRWYFDGMSYTEEEHKKLMEEINFNRNLKVLNGN